MTVSTVALFSLSSTDYTATVKRVTDREVAAARLTPDYAALVGHFGITSDTASATVTDVARTIVVDGAHAAGTRIGESITVDMLKGSDPGADAAHRVYWKAARAVRIGLVTAAGKSAASTDTDYLALAVKAAEAAAKHDVDPAAIAAAVALALFGEPDSK